MLQVSHLTCGYGGNPVLSDVSFTLEQGALSVIGPNGSGKTTLLRAIIGALPYEGEITLDGEKLTGMRPRKIAARVAMMSQFSEIYFPYSVWETVMMGRYLHLRGRAFAAPGPADTACVEHCLTVTGLQAVKNNPVTALSGGQLQRVYLARALAQEPTLILLDEPTNHLDLRYQVELISYLRHFSEQNDRAVVGVMHDINLAAQLGGPMLLLDHGRAAAFGDSREVLRGKAIAQAYEMDVAGYMRDTLGFWEG